MNEPQFLSVSDSIRLAYHRTEGASPGIVFCSGFKSDMTGAKALAVEEWARERGRACLRFDYTGHGVSSGRFEEGTIGQWAEDAITALDRLTEGPQILVGSSMGGWIILLAALARPERVRALVGLASAPDFTEDLMWEKMSPQQRQEVEEIGRFMVPNCYEEGDAYPITKALIEEGRRHLLLRASIALRCPVRLLHGLRDEDVPHMVSMRLMDQLESEDVTLTLIKDGDHRLSRPQDLARLTAALDGLCGELVSR